MSSDYPTILPTDLEYLIHGDMDEVFRRSLDENLNETADINGVIGLISARRLAARVVSDPDSFTNRQLMELSEHASKQSGLLKRQEGQKENDRVILQIIIGDRQVDLVANAEKVIDAEPVDPLAGVRQWLPSAPTVEFDDAPEF